MSVRLEKIVKAYGRLEVVHSIDLEIAKGEFVVFVGPSGCGKSTLLRMIAGLEEITSGRLFIGGNEVGALPPAERGIAMVFQSYALYPHLSVFDNMAFSLRIAKRPKEEIRRRVEEAARILQLEPYLERLPRALSGGQRQRVAIGRAIVREPQVFLFDEPLSNLDAALRVATRIEIAKLHESLPEATMIYVTHDQVEAMTLADRIVVLSQGHVEQVGTPLELYERPANLFVANFIGSPAMNILEAELEAGDGASAVLRLPGGGRVRAERPVGGGREGERFRFGVRPEDLELIEGGDLESEGELVVRVHFVESLGEYALVYAGLAGAGDGEEGKIIAKLPGTPELARGEEIRLRAAPERCHLFDAEGVAI